MSVTVKVVQIGTIGHCVSILLPCWMLLA